MDIQMLGMDGITATRLIRNLPSPARAVPIIAMTANVLPRQVTAFHETGMNDHVGKPFKRDELFAIIGQWVGRSALPDTGGPETAGLTAA
jgi:CheY-like chemotaxis protein